MLILIHGENSFESKAELTKVLKKNAQASHIDGSDLSNLDEIFVSLDNYSLFQETKPKITLVKRFLKNKKKTLHDSFVQNIKEINTDSIDIVFWEDSKADKRGKFYKIIKKVGDVREYNYPNEQGLQKWLLKSADRLELSLPKNLGPKVIDRVGTDQEFLFSELTKLKLYLNSEKRVQVKEEDIGILSSMNQEGDIWELLGALSMRDKKKALEICELFLKNPNQFPYLIAMLAKQLKLLILLKENISVNELSSELKIHPYTISKGQRYLHRFEKSHVKMLFRKLADLDFAIKQGKIEPKLGLNLFLATI